MINPFSHLFKDLTIALFINGLSSHKFLMNNNFMDFQFFFLSLTVVCLHVGVEVIVALYHTPWPHISGRDPLDEGSTHRRDLYLTTHNTYNRRQTSIRGRDSNPQSQ
jgi:hypothetical protein